MKKVRNVYGPVKEQFIVLIEYINILEAKRKKQYIEDLNLLIDLINNVSRQCEIYLKFELVKGGNTDD